jgi:hypothetical protein
MKLEFPCKRSNALTLTEVLVILALIAILAAMLIPATSNRKKALRVLCMNNLKQTAIAFKIWSPDQSDKYPTQVSVKWSGAQELVVTRYVGALFQVMSNELTTPNILICPADASRHWATNFTTDFGNRNISYFIGLDASEDDPDSILIGDDNFEIGGVPVKSIVLQISTNTPLAWTGERHQFIGNIALADGSVQTTTASSLTNAIIKQYLSEFLKPSRFTNVASSESAFSKTNRFRFAIP